MTVRDGFEQATDLGDACESVLLSMFYLTDDMGLAGFPPELIKRYDELCKAFADDFVDRYPEREKDAIWR